ncbi:MAG TPA: hypothetical protein VNN07_14660 [Candidatus Tectomicrobia bacterium]|nr:hypothetical protein [Candidatus Tectomicrobia bacterium]
MPATGATPPAPVVEEDELVAGRFRLPLKHRYEWYAPDGRYVAIDVRAVPRLLEHREPVFDRTERMWVHHPSTGFTQRYLIPSDPAAAPDDVADDIVQGRFRIPRAHRYERFTEDGRYVAVDAASVPERLERGEAIFDRTAGTWVHHPSAGYGRRYLVAPADTR